MRSIAEVLRALEQPRLGDRATTAPRPANKDDGPHCPICHDAGYLCPDVPPGDARLGQLVPCKCRVRERERRRHEELLRLGNLGPFEDKTFDTFDPGVNADVRAAFRFAVDYALDPVGCGTPWVFFHGRCGTGKTHLAAAIANHYVARQGGRALFTIVPDLLDHLRATFNPVDTAGTVSPGRYDRRFGDVREVPLLVLDDLGTENATPWAREKLYQLLNGRYNERLSTVVTSNHDFSRIDERIVSRLSDSRLCRYIPIDAPDYRRRAASAPVAAIRIDRTGQGETR